MKRDVVELFAGVGGFRVGLNKVSLKDDVTLEEENFRFVWVNQWEPSTKIQHAFECYEKRFGRSASHSNVDISTVDKNTIPDHSLLVGGFPCQDYSVAKSLSNERGIEGKKGVLWWQIFDILNAKKPPFVLLENVDRLLKSPSKQRGRDFGIMLKGLNDLNYTVEWRVINAAEYGHPQKRRRVFIFAYLNTTKYDYSMKSFDVKDRLLRYSLFAKQFPVEQTVEKISSADLSSKSYKSLVEVSNLFNHAFLNSGIAQEGKIFSCQVTPTASTKTPLCSILERNVDTNKYSIENKLDKFIYLKGSKKIKREKNGISYFYSEGGMAFPENLNEPGRTMLTSEASTNRSTHVVSDLDNNVLRFLTPVEAERLNEFPDNWTNTGMPLKRRYFMMGNALVVGIIKKLSDEIAQIIDNE